MLFVWGGVGLVFENGVPQTELVQTAATRSWGGLDPKLYESDLQGTSENYSRNI